MKKKPNALTRKVAMLYFVLDNALNTKEATYSNADAR